MNYVSDYSIWWLLPWLFVSVGLSIFFYKNENWVKTLDKKWQYLLKGLRASSLFILGLLVIGILFESVRYRNEKPVFITVFDNSESMLNYKDSSTLKSKLVGLNRKIKENYKNKFEFSDYTIGTNFESTKEPRFNENSSNLSSAFENILSTYYNKNIGGILFVSDGNFNKGSNPIYSAEKINLTPIFTIGVGDTIPKKDHFIKNVVSNEIAFLKNKFPIEVDIEANKIGKSGATISILKKGKTIAQENISYENGSYDFKHVSFLIDADEVGYQQYSVVLSKKENEYNYSNNIRSFYVEILDSRSKVLLLAGAPHPDIAAIKSVIEKDENLQVESKLIKDWDKNLSKVDLVIIDEPGIQFDPSVMNKIEEAKIPILYILGPNTSSNTISKLNIGLTVSASNQFDEVQGKINSDFQLFEVSDELKKAFSYFPPLNVKFGQIRLASGNSTMIYQRVGNIQKEEPMLFFGDRNSSKYGVIYGEGIWKWKINEYLRTKENTYFNELFQKITQFLLIKKNSSSLRVTLPKRFTVDEDIQVNAEFYNESLELITKPEINLSLTTEKGKIIKYGFGVVGNQYRLNLGKLKAGKYSWKAFCNHNGKNYSKNGIFVVEDHNMEKNESCANHNILQQISTNSNGKFYTLKNAEKFVADLGNRKDIAEISFKESSFLDLIDYKWLFFLLIIIFGLEWFLRKYFGSY